MQTAIMSINELKAAAYNPRQDLQLGDPEYEALLRSFDKFGDVEPVIFNKQTGNIVGGHQRIKIYKLRGVEEIEVVVVDLDDEDEKVLNIALNKIKGRWELGKLEDLLMEIQEDAEDIEVTGFKKWEIENLFADYNHIEDLTKEDFSDNSKEESSSFIMTFTLPVEVKKEVKEYITKNSNNKAILSATIINKIKGGVVIED